MSRQTKGPTRSGKAALPQNGRVEIKVDTLARVEGEGAVKLTIQDGRVSRAILNIYEPPRFFEAFLQGREGLEAPDLTARICGICPVAYQMSAAQAVEQALGITPPPGVRELRRLLYLGEWIESHALHVYMLHAPDFLGYQGGVEMAADHPERVALGLKLKKTGNSLMTAVGGREIHPVNTRVGGFYKAPETAKLKALLPALKEAQAQALSTLEWTAGFNFPQLERDYEFVSLRHATEYPILDGKLATSSGLEIDAAQYPDHFEEYQAAHSNALHSHRLPGKTPYLVGPLARYNLNHDRLPPHIQKAAASAGLGPVERNPYKSILVRSVELLWAVEEAAAIIQNYQPPAQPYAPCPPKAGVGHGFSEAPRGVLYHRYQLDEAGLIVKADIVPPTAQNLRSMELDLEAAAQANLHLEKEPLTWLCEQTVRNHDPCISCATHFLTLTLD